MYVSMGTLEIPDILNEGVSLPELDISIGSDERTQGGAQSGFKKYLPWLLIGLVILLIFK